MRLSALVVALGLALGPAIPAHAQEKPIQEVIEGQIAALQADDFALAFSFASPTIKGLFGTSTNFGLMVKEGYPMVYRPSDVEMQELREIAGNLWQRVRVVDQSGKTWFLDYMMIETPEGWQINAVQILPAPEIGV